MARRLQTWEFWRPCLALFFIILFTSLFDFSSVPSSAGHLAAVSKLPRLAGALAILAAAGVFCFRPALAAQRWFGAIFLVMLLAGIVGFLVAIIAGPSFLLTISAWLMSIGCEWVVIAAYASIATLERPHMSLAIVVGFALSALVCLVLVFLPHIVKTVLMVIAGPLSYLLARQDLKPALSRSQPLAHARENDAFTKSLPAMLRLALFILLYEAAYGFSIYFADAAEMPITPAAGLLPAIALVAYLLVTRGEFPYVGSSMASVLFAIVGFLVAPLQMDGAVFLGDSCIAISAFLFVTSMRYCFCVLGQENRGVELALYALSAGIAGLGFVLGSLLGDLATQAISTSPSASAIVTSIFVMIFFVACALTLKNKSIAETLDLQGTPQGSTSEPASGNETQGPAAPQPTPFKDLVAGLAAEQGLSPRETEVFFLLARGRNREHIQQKLVISKDTAKAHIKHVYAKLGVHSQQELIDLVDREWEEQ